MEKKPYSDRRWWEAPKAFDSACNSCTRYHGYAKCDISRWDTKRGYKAIGSGNKQLQRGFLQRSAEKESMMGTRRGAY